MAILVTPANKTFSQIGNDKWFSEGFDLDRLIVRVMGPKSGLTTYINALTTWAVHGSFTGMYLSTWSVDDDPVKPTVDLTYIGKKGGVTSGTLRKNNSTSAQAASFSDSTGTGSLRIEIGFYAPTNTATTIATDHTMPTPDSVGSVAYSDLFKVSVTITGDYSIAGNIMDFFTQITGVSTDSNEVVKGQYYRNTRTYTLVMQPIL